MDEGSFGAEARRPNISANPPTGSNSPRVGDSIQQMPSRVAPCALGEVFRNSACAVDRRTLALIAEHLGWNQDVADLRLNLLLEKRSTFHRFLEKKLIARADRLEHLKSLRRLIRAAEELGWEPKLSLSPQWQSLMKPAPGDARDSRGAIALGCVVLVRHFAAQGMEPADLTREQINAWVDGQVINRERTFVSAWEAATKFTTLLLRRGFSNVDPIAAARLEDYGVPLSEIGRTKKELKEEIEKLLEFRANAADGTDDDEDLWEDEDEIDDPNAARTQIRPITVQTLEGSICRLYGYLDGAERSAGVRRLRDLYNPEFFEGYRRFLISSRLVAPCNLRSVFQPLVAAAQQYGALAPQRNWVRNFFDQLPGQEADAVRRERIALKTLPYAELAAIPGKILKERLALQEVAGRNPSRNDLEQKRLSMAVSQLAMRELLVRWILELPWRARNICECRLEGAARNLFLGTVCRYSTLARDPSILVQLEKSPRKTFWQYRFAKSECKGNAEIHRLLPDRLTDPLEKYVKYFRGTPQAETLFTNANGTQLTVHTLYSILCEITLQHGGKRLSTKVFRDVYASEYLQRHKGYAVLKELSNLLWHKYTTTTRRYYATQYNFSAVTECVESYLAERKPQRNVIKYAPFAPFIGFIGWVVAVCAYNFGGILPLMLRVAWRHITR